MSESRQGPGREEDSTTLAPGPLAAPPPVPPPDGSPGFAPPGRPEVPPSGLPASADAPSATGSGGSTPAETAWPGSAAVVDAGPAGPGATSRIARPALVLGAVAIAAAVIVSTTGMIGSGHLLSGRDAPSSFGAPFLSASAAPRSRPASTVPPSTGPTDPAVHPASSPPTSAGPPVSTPPSTPPASAPPSSVPATATPPPRPPMPPGGATLAAAYRTIGHIPAALLARDRRSAIVDGSGTVPGARVLRNGGRPEILFVGQPGARPSATERWAVVVALSQFGTFSGGSTTQVIGAGGRATPTFLFDGIHFHGSAITFRAVEMRYRGTTPVTTLSRTQQRLWGLDDSSRSLPWLDLGGPTAIEGSQVPPTAVAGHTFGAIVTSLTSGRSGAAFAIDGAAGALVTQICETTGQQPTDVCKAFQTGDG